MSYSENAWKIFNKAISDYHLTDDVDAAMPQSEYTEGSLEHYLYRKNWIDTVQWHLEDIIRDKDISPADALVIKRRIDESNQQRTDLVEFMDAWFYNKFSNISVAENARLNTETPAWALDRLSILALKVYHMSLEAGRTSADMLHRQNCEGKLAVLLRQKEDLCTAIDQLLQDIGNGKVKMAVYKQMKMYNDESLNPILYQSKGNAKTS